MKKTRIPLNLQLFADGGEPAHEMQGNTQPESQQPTTTPASQPTDQLVQTLLHAIDTRQQRAEKSVLRSMAQQYGLEETELSAMLEDARKRKQEQLPPHVQQHISDGVWRLLKPHLPGQRGQWGGISQDNRRFINGVFWILRTGAPWRDLPPCYGKWGTVYQRFRRWRDKGIWEKLLEILVDEPDLEWLMIDASHCKVHPHAAGARGGNQDMSCTKGGSIPRFTLPWMPNGRPVRILITEGNPCY